MVEPERRMRWLRAMVTHRHLSEIAGDLDQDGAAI